MAELKKPTLTGNDILEKALLELNYTTPTGEPDPKLNQENTRKALQYINKALLDLQLITKDETIQPIAWLNEVLPVPDVVSTLVIVPSLAADLAQGIGDADQYNRFRVAYLEERRRVPPATMQVQDVQPYPALA